MPTLTVHSIHGERFISFSAGRSLRDILDDAGLRVRSGCLGMGACGLCRVRIEGGDAGAPSANERIHLDGTERARGIRLACQVMPEQNLQIEIEALSSAVRWERLSGDVRRNAVNASTLSPSNPPREVPGVYGVAVDLGTTHISLSLYELASGTWLAGRYGPNPQMHFGADIMTRLVAASQSPEQASVMSQQVLRAIGEALFDMASGDNIDVGRIFRLTIVGNTAMLSLLSGRNYGLLLQPGRWMGPIDCRPEDSGAWAAAWGLRPQTQIEVISPLAGFVGSDLLAGVFTTHLTEAGPGSLFIDFGTNSEIALWDGRTLWVTSAAGGPAFEESGISCGAPAEPGAIYRVGFRDEACYFSVLAGIEPRGLCGSGLVDLIAGLLRTDRLTITGQFTKAVPPEGFTVARGERAIVLTKRDVDGFQRAKAAIGTGIHVLLTKAGMGWEDLKRICVGGFFGRFLDIVNAQEIGLLPAIAPHLVELWGNTALAGCADTLLVPDAVGHIADLRAKVSCINLSSCPDFAELFLDNLYLLPLKGGMREETTDA